MISEQLQVSNATSTSETLPPKSSAFSTQQILSQSVHETEKSLPSSQQKKAEMLGRGGSIYVQLYITIQEEKGMNKLNRKKNGLKTFQKHQTLCIQLLDEGILSTLEWTTVKMSISKKDTFFGNSVTYQKLFMGPKLSPMKILLYSQKLLNIISYFAKCTTFSKCIQQGHPTLFLFM